MLRILILSIQPFQASTVKTAEIFCNKYGVYLYIMLFIRFVLTQKFSGDIGGKQVGVILLVCFVALRPKSTAMVIVGRSAHLTTLFPGQA